MTTNKRLAKSLEFHARRVRKILKKQIVSLSADLDHEAKHIRDEANELVKSLTPFVTEVEKLENASGQVLQRTVLYDRAKKRHKLHK